MERSKQPVKNTPDRETVMRDKRAQGIAAMGLVVREGEIFKVTEPSLRGRRTTHDVWRDDSGRIRCTCADFNQESKTSADYRCVHQLSVKHHILRKTSPAGAPGKDTDVLTAELRPTTHPEGTPQMNSKASQTDAGGEHPAAVIPITFTTTLRTLRQPVDPKLIKTREGWTDRNGNKHMVEYVEWHVVADILDRVAPTWSHAVRNITQIGGMVAVTAAITIQSS